MGTKTAPRQFTPLEEAKLDYWTSVDHLLESADKLREAKDRLLKLTGDDTRQVSTTEGADR